MFFSSSVSLHNEQNSMCVIKSEWPAKPKGVAMHENLSSGFSTKSDTNHAVQLQKMAKSLKVPIQEKES